MMEIISANALISINATFFAQLISFLVFMFILNKIMIKPLRKNFTKRSNYLKKINNKIDYSKKQLDELSSELARKKTITLDESFSTINEMEKKAKTKASLIYNKTKKKVIDLHMNSNKEIQQQINKVRNNFHRDVDDITKLILDKILNGRLVK